MSLSQYAKQLNYHDVFLYENKHLDTEFHIFIFLIL